MAKKPNRWLRPGVLALALAGALAGCSNQGTTTQDERRELARYAITPTASQSNQGGR